jgi:hypothetical protein
MPSKKERKAAAVALDEASAEGPVANCSWSNNNAACANTWFCLSKAVMGQLTADFKAAASVKMSELAFWNSVAPANREAEAGAIAAILTNSFVNLIGAEYEPGQNFASAVLAMKAILSDGNKTVCELAAVVDEQHHFLIGEA